MPTLIINGVSIDFPDSGTDPNWAPAVIQFAEQVQIALSLFSNASDIPPQTQDISAENPGTNITIPSLAFSTVLVRSAFIKYAVYRTTTTTTVYEAGDITVVYSENNPVNQKWEIQRDYVGNADITFSIDDNGQMSFSTTAISGLDHTGTLSFLAPTLLQTLVT